MGDTAVNMEDQMKVEVDWCMARLEEKLAALDPYSKSGNFLLFL